MTKATELTIRAQAAVKYPGWRVDFAGPATVVLTHIMGWRQVIEVRQRRKRCDGLWMRAAKRVIGWLRRIYWQAINAVKWIVPAVMWLLGMWMVSMSVMAMALGVF